MQDFEAPMDGPIEIPTNAWFVNDRLTIRKFKLKIEMKNLQTPIDPTNQICTNYSFERPIFFLLRNLIWKCERL